MSLMAVLVKIIRSDVRVSFVSRPVSQSRQPSRSVMAVVPTISRYKDYTRRHWQLRKMEWKSLLRIRPQLLSSLLDVCFQEYRKSTKEWYFLRLWISFPNGSTSKMRILETGGDRESILLNLDRVHMGLVILVCRRMCTHFLLYRITGINLTRKNYSRQIFRAKLSKFDCAHPAPPPRTSCRIFYLKCNNYLRERAFFVNI